MRHGGHPETNVEVSTFNQSDAAAKLNVSRESVIHAVTVKAHGAPELQEDFKGID